jgi:hypothetical protein
MKKLLEKEVVDFTLKAGELEVSKTKNLVAGNIVGVMVYHTNIDKANGQIENCKIQIKQANSEKVVQLMPVKNLRSRECCYSDSFVPVDFRGGQDVTIDLYNKKAFTVEDVNFSVVFVYDVTFEKTNC